jgi:GT2 family glycosyltransferase
MTADNPTSAQPDQEEAYTLRPAHLSSYLSGPSFWAPQYVEQSAWLDHGPFAFWLIDAVRPSVVAELGTHNGYSYFAFCQAVKALGLDARCYAIDHWEGDEHAGEYGDEIYRKVMGYNDTHYSSFSRLVRATFDEALEHFEDGSIDLLHIDGRHFYDDVAHDFRSWQPKLSNRAVVLFHDINVREREFGVFKLWGEVKSQYPSFEFHHGHGLGVLGFGANLPERMVDFFEAADHPGVALDIRRTYARLGVAFKSAYDAEHINTHLKDHIEWLDSRIVAERDEAQRNMQTALERAHENAIEVESRARERFAELAEKHELLSEKLEGEVAWRASLETELKRRETLIKSLKNSTSWRITAPIRSFRRIPGFIKGAVKRGLAACVRFFYRGMPLPARAKHKIADAVYRLARPIIGDKDIFRRWEHTRSQIEKEAKRQTRRPKRITLREVARPIEADHSVAVPFGYYHLPPPPDLAVIIHMFYEHMTPEFQLYLRNIPYPFDLYISTDTPEKKAVIERFLENETYNHAEVRLAENRGRDIAPKLIAFRDVYDRYEYVLHVHSKWSDHASELANWRGYILETLLGSGEIVHSVFEAFGRVDDIGIIAAQHFEPVRHWINWGHDYKIAKALSKRMGFDLPSEKSVLDFPSGSMFWARTDALKPLLDLELKYEDFPPEQNQIDETLAHAIERLYFYVCEHAGFQWLKIAHRPLMDHTPAIVSIDHHESLRLFVHKHGLQLTGPNVPEPRSTPPDPIHAPAADLVSRRQDRMFGIAEKVDPAHHVVVGVVTYNNTQDQIERITASAAKALTHAGLAAEGRVLILDNGASTESFTADNGAVRHLSAAGNVGFGAGHNRIMNQAFADGADIYIAANPDGAFHFDAIRALVQMIKAHHGRVLVEAIQFPVEHPKMYDPFTFDTPWVSGACLAIPRLAYEEVGTFDESFFMYCEDVDYAWRAKSSGFALKMCPRAVFMHAVSNRKQDADTVRMIYTSGICLARKWGNVEFESWLTNKLRERGWPAPEIQPVAVPESWQRIPDFSHQFIFAQTRW